MLGAPSGATGCRYGSQSGTESRSSVLIVPLKRAVMGSPARLLGVRIALSGGPQSSSRRDECCHRRTSRSCKRGGLVRAADVSGLPHRNVGADVELDVFDVNPPAFR